LAALIFFSSSGMCIAADEGIQYSRGSSGCMDRRTKLKLMPGAIFTQGHKLTSLIDSNSMQETCFFVRNTNNQKGFLHFCFFIYDFIKWRMIEKRQLSTPMAWKKIHGSDFIFNERIAFYP